MRSKEKLMQIKEAFDNTDDKMKEPTGKFSNLKWPGRPRRTNKVYNGYRMVFLRKEKTSSKKSS